MPQEKIVILYKQKDDGSGIQFTGIYLGDGTFVDVEEMMKVLLDQIG